MTSGYTVLALMVVYIILCTAILYFCVIADPNKNDTAFFVTVTLPQKIWDKMGQLLGQKNLNVLASAMDLALVMVYFAVVLGCWVVVFTYIYPWITESSYVSNFHKFSGYAVFLACFSSWRLTNKSSPGIISEKTFSRYSHYPYDNLLFVPDRRCDSTNLVKIARSKFDRLKYNQNVPRYDHFCGWVHNTIGEENYRFFLLFLTVHVGMCAYGSAVTILLFRGEIISKELFHLTFFDRATGETFKADWFIIMQYLFTRRMAECCVLAVMSVMGIALSCFLGYHVYLTTYNLTTNEASKWQDVRDWYKKEKKRYDDAVDKGLVPSSAASATETADGNDSSLNVNDKDVTCTPGVGDSSTNNSPSGGQVAKRSAPRYRDPGPIPKNLYDRGFIENWKEVIFPISLRKETLNRVAAAASSSGITYQPQKEATSKSPPVKRTRGRKPKVT